MGYEDVGLVIWTILVLLLIALFIRSRLSGNRERKWFSDDSSLYYPDDGHHSDQHHYDASGHCGHDGGHSGGDAGGH